MAHRPLLNDDGPSDDDEPELIPRRSPRSSTFSKPFEVRAGWLIVVGVGLLTWQAGWSDWRKLIEQLASGPTELGLLVLIVPLGLAWWTIRRKVTRRHSSNVSDDDNSVRVLEEQDDESRSFKLLSMIVAYVLAVLCLIALSVCRMAGWL